MSSRAAPSPLVPLTPPRRGEGVVEPYVAIDPADPRRAATVATCPAKGRGLGHSVWCWRTTNGGKTWIDDRIVQPRLNGAGVSDPLIGYCADGALIAVAITHDEAYVDALNELDESFSRLTSPTIEERMHAWAGALETRELPPPNTKICISRSEDHGQTWSGTAVPKSDYGDKTALAIDQHASSPYRGHVYVAWSNLVSNQLEFARSVDGGRTADPAVPIGARNGFANVQIAVGPDGTVHVLWIHLWWTLPDAEDEQAARSGFFYARSDDGGASFTEPRIVAEHGGIDRVGMIDLAAAPSGGLLVAWSEADTLSRKRGTQPPQTLRLMHSEDGGRWSEPARVSRPAPDLGQGLPAVASTAHAWHVLSYDATTTATTVRIYSAGHGDLEFRPTEELATRHVGLQDIWLGGAYQLRNANDVLFVGDYVGLAGAGSHLAVAIALPERDTSAGQVTAYAAILDEQSLLGAR
jgi:hypothetical protein